MPSLERVVGNLVDYLETNRSLGFEEDCFILMAAFIQYSEKISSFVVALFRLIPDIFYG